MHPSVSVVMPIRNEQKHLRAAIDRVLDQGYPGELEVVLAVAPSTDATEALANELASVDPRIRVVSNPAGFTPVGLNLAIRHAAHDIIVRVDGHGELSPGYISTAVELLEETGAANVGGLMDARGAGPLSEAIAAAYNSRLGLGGGGFHLDDTPAGPADTVFLGVFRREAIEAVGGFDETMQRAQDWELNYRLRKSGKLVYFSPELRVLYRPRDSFRALGHQFYRTGQWRREVMRRYPETSSLRYLAPPMAVSGIAVGLAGGSAGLVLRSRGLTSLLLAPLGYLSFLALATAIMPDLSRAARVRLPLVLATMHMAWGFGFLRGVER